MGSKDGKTVYTFTILPPPESAGRKQVKIDAVSGTVIKLKDETSSREGRGGHSRDRDEQTEKTEE